MSLVSQFHKNSKQFSKFLRTHNNQSTAPTTCWWNPKEPFLRISSDTYQRRNCCEEIFSCCSLKAFLWNLLYNPGDGDMNRNPCFAQLPLIFSLLPPEMLITVTLVKISHIKNIARVRNCPDVTILNSLFGLCLLSFCIFVFLSVCQLSWFIFCLFVLSPFCLFVS